MEQKRTLWIIAAVGVFLLVVLGAALMIYAPAAKPAQTVASSRGNEKGTASNGWISLAPADATQGRPYDYSADAAVENPDSEAVEVTGSEFRTDEVNIYAETANVYSETTNLNGLGKNAQAVINTTTIDLNTKSEPVPPAAVTKTPAKTVSTPVTATAKAAPVKSAAKAEPVKTVAKAPVKTTTAKPFAVKQTVSTKTSASVQAKPAVTQYWIQVTALTSRKSADAAREVLGQNQITADVFTYTDAKNQLFYRVRVGPYTTKSEAEYWRTKIAKIDNFKNIASYVTATKVE